MNNEGVHIQPFSTLKIQLYLDFRKSDIASIFTSRLTDAGFGEFFTQNQSEE
jgi:hypothetical protein